MPQSPKELSLADVQRLLKETADWLDVANHAQTEVEWRVEMLKPLLPPGGSGVASVDE